MDLWHYALKLNKAVYKISANIADGEPLKNQIREQANEILSTVSLYFHRQPAQPGQPARINDDFHALLNKTTADKNTVNFYVPEASICLLLLLDKITVVKAYLLLAVEHNFFSEENYLLLNNGYERLYNLIKNKLSDPEFFNHPLFSPEVVPPSVIVPPRGISRSDDETKQSLPNSDTLNHKRYTLNTSPADETLSDILNNISDIANETNETLSDISAKKAENYISKSKFRQNKNKPFYKAFFGILKNSVSPEVVPPPGFGGPTSQHSLPTSSLNAKRYTLNASSNSVALAEPVLSVIVPPRGISRSDDETKKSLPNPTLRHSDSPAGGEESLPNSYTLNPKRYTLNASPLTVRQQKIYFHIAENGKAKVGDLTALFPEKISEKTIRRDLQILIDNSLVAQSGSKRWTQYSLR